jgi:hypothetical protein
VSTNLSPALECADMDSQIDVALHTLVQMAPEHLYYHIKVVEQLVWEPWLAENEAQFCLLLMVRSRWSCANVLPGVARITCIHCCTVMLAAMITLSAHDGETFPSRARLSRHLAPRPHWWQAQSQTTCCRRLS